MLYPLTFYPIFKERVWGGRNLHRLYGKAIPETGKIGESWEISDRPGDASVVAAGPLAGKTLRWLMENHAVDLCGPGTVPGAPFPLLLKILDAEETLSLQVHPPAEKAAQLGGEPKTEMWYIADARPDAALYVGLRDGVTRGEFQRRLKTGEVDECFHKIAVKSGDAMFLPSGRVHGIGGGNVIFEIQQNSDTTYRVFDWNRVGLDGKPRELHIQQSMESIQFDDYEPELLKAESVGKGAFQFRYLVNDPLFSVNVTEVRRGERYYVQKKGAEILAILRGRIRVSGGGVEVTLVPGQFVLLPASLTRVAVEALMRAEFLQVQF